MACPVSNAKQYSALFAQFDGDDLAGDGFIGDLGIFDFRLQSLDICAGVEIALWSEIQGAELDQLEVVAI
jgi:hypothetical protein